MIARPRAAAVKIVAVYWALLVFGMVLYSALRSDALATLAPVWTGTIGGTVLGQILAARRYRAWLAVLTISAVAIVVLPQLRTDLSGKQLWLAFLPAALCGYWSLGDRTSLAAFWFPAVIWMLSILDGTDANAMPDRNGFVLFAVLAGLFVVYLRVREERRVALWRTVAPEPLATVRPELVLRDRTGLQLARAAWAVLVTGLGFAATAWVAPKLWQPETIASGHVAAAAPHRHHLGLPCCPSVRDVDIARTRVKEYFDLGRGHEQIEPPHEPGIDCQVCRAVAHAPANVDPVIAGVGGGGGGYGAYEGVPVGPSVYTTGTIDTTGYPAGDVPTLAPEIDPWSHATLDPESAAYQQAHPQPVPAPPVVAPPATPSVASTDDFHPSPTFPPPQPRADPTYVPPPPQVEPQTPPPHEPQAQEQPVQPAPAAAPAVSPDDPPPPARDDDAPARRPASAAGPEVLHWGAVVVAAMFLIQLVALVLRPLRRLVTLRHLRRPFWAETVDQRVSNAWQLVLVGLRDAGWRASHAESPRDLARRVGVDGVEQCATILDRARHGIRIDRGDLETMTAGADTAYRSARARTGRFARVVSWLRWPLV